MESTPKESSAPGGCIDIMLLRMPTFDRHARLRDIHRDIRQIASSLVSPTAVPRDRRLAELSVLGRFIRENKINDEQYEAVLSNFRKKDVA